MPSGDMAPPIRGEKKRLAEGLGLPPAEAARFLLGKRLVRRLGDRWIATRIVETEAYLGVGDPAAHAFHGRTARTEPLWGPPGTLYVYFIYGMHHCLNIAVEPKGTPGCVLIRALEPLPSSGLGPLDCRGPGRLCRALEIDRRLSGASALEGSSGLYLRDGARPARIEISPRIGISSAADRPLRFFDATSLAVSRAPGATGRTRRGSL